MPANSNNRIRDLFMAFSVIKQVVLNPALHLAMMALNETFSLQRLDAVGIFTIKNKNGLKRWERSKNNTSDLQKCIRLNSFN